VEHVVFYLRVDLVKKFQVTPLSTVSYHLNIRVVNDDRDNLGFVVGVGDDELEKFDNAEVWVDGIFGCGEIPEFTKYLVVLGLIPVELHYPEKSK